MGEEHTVSVSHWELGAPTRAGRAGSADRPGPFADSLEEKGECAGPEGP